jgi:hypothetical protein
VGGIEMGQRYRLERCLSTPIGVPRDLPSRSLAWFLDTVNGGRSRGQTTDTPKATEPSFRAALSACFEIIRQRCDPFPVRVCGVKG